MSDRDGGPAFPRTGTLAAPSQTGMTLRQWYAGQVIAGIYASGTTIPDPVDSMEGFRGVCDAIARIAAVQADAMMAELQDPHQHRRGVR